LGAILLYAAAERNTINKARGVEIVSGLVDRSRKRQDPLTHATEPKFILGDMYMESEEMSALLVDTTFAVCFATTDQKTSLHGRALIKLSSTLTLLPTRSDYQWQTRWEGWI
jgi:hypothetical protein